jgi:hypothetical protein
MYNGICTLKFNINYNPVNYDKKTGFHNNKSVGNVRSAIIVSSKDLKN